MPKAFSYKNMTIGTMRCTPLAPVSLLQIGPNTIYELREITLNFYHFYVLISF